MTESQKKHKTFEDMKKVLESNPEYDGNWLWCPEKYVTRVLTDHGFVGPFQGHSNMERWFSPRECMFVDVELHFKGGKAAFQPGRLNPSGFIRLVQRAAPFAPGDKDD